MPGMGTTEAAKKWGVTQETVRRWCKEGKITPQPQQDKKFSAWHIDVDAIPPMTKSKKTV